MALSDPVILCRTISKFCRYLWTSFVSPLSHSVEQALSWGNVWTVLLCRAYKSTFSEDAKLLEWWHWDAEGKPFFDHRYKTWLSPINFHKLVIPEEDLPCGQSWLTEHPANQLTHDAFKHTSLWMFGSWPEMNSGCECVFMSLNLVHLVLYSSSFPSSLIQNFPDSLLPSTVNLQITFVPFFL